VTDRNEVTDETGCQFSLHRAFHFSRLASRPFARNKFAPQADRLVERGPAREI
jgi:hypothetical protein